MPSFRARLLAGVVRIGRVGTTFDGPDRIRRSIARDRANGPATPSATLRARFDVREEDVGGCRVHIVGPRTGQARRRVLYLHGGGWVLSITDFHWRFVERLVHDLDCSVVVPRYPLAPEHGARDAFAVLLPLYASLVADPGQPPLTVMGDSTGGNLALSLAMQARHEALPQPARLVLISPSMDATFTDPAIPALDRIDPILSARGARELARLYAKDLDLRDPVVSPLFGPLDHLAPIAVFTGTREIPNADAHRLRRKASESGIPLSWHEYPGMLHTWPLFPIPEATRAITEMATFVQRVGGPPP
jgi:acetyl esterase/lipase